MPTQEIPRQEWNKFFDSFSRQHEGWLVTLEIFGPEIGAQEEARELPLEGISIASGTNEPEAIASVLGSRRKLTSPIRSLSRRTYGSNKLTRELTQPWKLNRKTR